MLFNEASGRGKTVLDVFTVLMKPMSDFYYEEEVMERGNRKEREKEGRKEGKKEGRKEGRKEGKEGKKKERKGRREAGVFSRCVISKRFLGKEKRKGNKGRDGREGFIWLPVII